MRSSVPSGRAWYRRPSRFVPLATLGAVAGLVATSLLTPRPAALLIRTLFDRDSERAADEMSLYEPNGGIRERLDLPYADGGAATSLDVFTPETATGPLPAVVWIHGGAWISGRKEHVRPYARMIASRGFAAVAVNYPVAPEHRYPAAPRRLMEALAHVLGHAEDLGIDPQRIVLAGDSAGANLASQLATLITNPEYAAGVGIAPALAPGQLRGAVLNCGIYDVSGIPDVPGLNGWGFRKALRSYLGGRDWADSRGDREMSTLDHVTGDFPPTWISGGNGDPLTRKQSIPLADRLEGLGVDVTRVFHPDDLAPALPHEYQFHLDFPEARAAFESTVAFLERVTR